MVGTSKFELFVDDNDLSSQIKKLNTYESATDWFVHAILENGEPASGALAGLDGRKVPVKFRFVIDHTEEGGEETLYPWRFGKPTLSYRPNEENDGELILYDTGRLDQDRSEDHVPEEDTQHTVTATIDATESVGGIIVNRRSEEGEITIFSGPSAELDRRARDAELEIEREREVKAVTSPGFVLSLASGAASSYRLLYNSGINVGDGSLLRSSLILLPLAVEYFIKFLLVRESGPLLTSRLLKKYKTHMLLNLFDALPFATQRRVEDLFKDELGQTGRPPDSHNIRVCLMRFRNAFTAMRYLFDPENANTSVHLQNPNHTIILVCVMNALERACGGPYDFRGVGVDYSTRPESELKSHEGENSQYTGSMYGVVDSLHNATEAMRQLQEHLPDGFMWPTNVDVSPGRVAIRWAQAPLREPGRTTLGDSVSLEATPKGVNMRAFFRQDHLNAVDVVDEEFEANTMASLLAALTSNWSWEVMEDGTASWTSPTTKPLPSDDTPVSDPGQENSGISFSDVGIDTISCRVGSLEVKGRGVPRMSAIWNNPIGKSSVTILVPFTDEVETWVNGIIESRGEGQIEPFEVVYEDAGRTAQLVMSGEGGVWPHPFGRNGVVAIVITDIPYLHRKAIDLTQSDTGEPKNCA